MASKYRAVTESGTSADQHLRILRAASDRLAAKNPTDNKDFQVSKKAGEQKREG